MRITVSVCRDAEYHRDADCHAGIATLDARLSAPAGGGALFNSAQRTKIAKLPSYGSAAEPEQPSPDPARTGRVGEGLSSYAACRPRPKIRSFASSPALSNAVVFARTSSTAAKARATASRLLMVSTHAISLG